MPKYEKYSINFSDFRMENNILFIKLQDVAMNNQSLEHDIF